MTAVGRQLCCTAQHAVRCLHSEVVLYVASHSVFCVILLYSISCCQHYCGPGCVIVMVVYVWHNPMKLKEHLRCGHGNLNYNSSVGRPSGYMFILTFLCPEMSL
jgi:hypothetical protein